MAVSISSDNNYYTTDLSLPMETLIQTEKVDLYSDDSLRIMIHRKYFK